MSMREYTHVSVVLFLALTNSCFSAQGQTLAPGQIPDLTVVDQNGTSRKFFTDLVKGKVVAINFAFASCGSICPLQLQRFSQLQDLLSSRLGKDVFLITITTDPVNDTPAKLPGWAKLYNAKPGWSLLSGDPSTVTSVVKAFISLSSKSDGHHGPTVVVINEPLKQEKADFALGSPTFLYKYVTTWKTSVAVTGSHSQRSLY